MCCRILTTTFPLKRNRHGEFELYIKIIFVHYIHMLFACCKIQYIECFRQDFVHAYLFNRIACHVPTYVPTNEVLLTHIF